MKFLRHSFSRWLYLFIAAFQLAAVAADSPWQRVVVIGASASAGFVLSEPFGGTNTTKCKLNYYLDAAITAPHAPVKNLATALMFINPDAFAPMQVEAATNDRPTLVIGVDFLFWFCYGEGRTDAARAQRFEQGLKLLERIPCPLVIGDIPDASSATNTGIIGPDQIPSATALAAANQRLRNWAAARPQVAVVPLAKFMRTVMDNEAVTVHGQSLPAGKTRTLMQNDRLHPTPRGDALLAISILDSLVSKNPEFPAADIRWNPQEVFRIGLNSAGPATTPKPEPARE
ncbi:MAG TPA: hypothetical protein VIK53_19190 [Verrucomicrobiae bacterium]